MSTTPFLSIPFHQSDIPDGYSLSEGYLYTDTPWYDWHGNVIHAGIDYDVPYGTKIYSPISGFASSSYNIQRAKHGDGSIRIHQDKNITYSLGYCIQIYDPVSKLFLLYGHLSYIADDIIFTPPFTTDTGEQFARGFNLTSEHINHLDDCSWLVPISRGQYLGDVGVSGIYLTNDLIPGNNKPLMRIPESRYPYYSNPHLHWNTYDRAPGGSKQNPIDPYDIYDYAHLYPDPQRGNKILGSDHLMMLGGDGLPVWID